MLNQQAISGPNCGPAGSQLSAPKMFLFCHPVAHLGCCNHGIPKPGAVFGPKIILGETPKEFEAPWIATLTSVDL